MENVIQITHQSLLENDWKSDDIKNQKYVHAFYPDLILFLSKDYGTDNNYMIKLLSTPDRGETVNLNLIVNYFDYLKLDYDFDYVCYCCCHYCY